jgi:hypothetical protein
MAVENPALEHAWRFRHLTDQERRTADAEFRQLEALYNRVQQAPYDPRKAQAMAQMERRGQELGLMMNAHKILNNVWRDVVKRARAVAPPIDPEATQTHDDVAWAVKQASSGDIPEPPVRWGSLSAKEGREKVMKEYGFDPGWSH